MVRIESRINRSLPKSEFRVSHGSELVQRIERTITLMRDNLGKPLQASALAAHASMSLSHFFALFKRVTGRTPIDYLIGLRMEKGRHLLETTALSVKEIAAELSYDDPFYFSRVFKAATGVAPTEYRVRRPKTSGGLTLMKPQAPCTNGRINGGIPGNGQRKLPEVALSAAPREI